MKFNAVIFDKDGVIVNTQPIHYKVFKDFCSEYGWEFTRDDYESFNGTTSMEMFHRINTYYPSDITIDKWVELFQNRYLKEIYNSDKLELITGVKELIVTLSNHGIHLAVASSARKEKINFILNKFDLSPYFDVIVSGYEVARSKPSPDIFLTAAERLGVPSKECIVIEDSTNGVVAAKQAGIYCIGYQNELGKQDLSLANYVVKDLNLLTNSSFARGIVKD
ncbi:HAD family phosphatase [Paenibacillus aurantius]|uniref:HAD family phosphatase n=1 Tax=Paenibacillus aurantius TaxID=2918900 RepID=A0AA96RDQ1_9BACL|nr:HAD family phosphatase [Paenibacillus aurantius]WNQ09656.1 HAD family phosphatase [Paenibacillus aurantius]